MKYSIATNWDDRLVASFKKFNLLSKKDKIIELFNSLPFACAIPSSQISKPEIEKKIKLIKRQGFCFNYLVNSSVFPDLHSRKGFKKAMEYITWVEKQKADIVTVGDEKILFFIYKYFPKLKVNISIVLRVKSVKKVNSLIKKYPNIERVTLYQAINRDQNKLIQHVANVHKRHSLRPFKIELLANELCLYDCPLMKKHYALSSKFSQSNTKERAKLLQELAKFDSWCNEIRARDPIQFLNVCWIRPEDVEIYEKLGIDILKIAGKTASTNYLLRTAKSYMKRSHRGNIMDLFYPDWWPQKKKPYINNSELDGFLEYLWSRNLKKIASYQGLKNTYKIKYSWNK